MQEQRETKAPLELTDTTNAANKKCQLNGDSLRRDIKQAVAANHNNYQQLHSTREREREATRPSIGCRLVTRPDLIPSKKAPLS